MSLDTLDTNCQFTVSPTGFSPSSIDLPISFGYGSLYVSFVLTPHSFLTVVWPPPISLATTLGISFDFFSSPYLDVSVQEVPFLNLCIQLRIYGSSP